jgi:hypothetical protein
MVDPRTRTRALATVLFIAALGVPPLGASADEGGFAPSGAVLATGLFDFLGGGKKLRAQLAEAQRRQARAEAQARAARADAERAEAEAAHERAAREREQAAYGRALTRLSAYGRDADEQRAQVARLNARLERETAIARALRRRFGVPEPRYADATPVAPPKRTGDAHPRERQQHRSDPPSISVGWGRI